MSKKLIGDGSLRPGDEEILELLPNDLVELTCKDSGISVEIVYRSPNPDVIANLYIKKTPKGIKFYIDSEDI